MMKVVVFLHKYSSLLTEPEPSGLATQEPEPEEEIISDEDDDMRNFIEDLDENGNPIRQPKKKRSGPRLSSTQLTEAHAVFGEFDLDGEVYITCVYPTPYTCS